MVEHSIISKELQEKAEGAADVASRIEAGVVNRPPLETQIFLASLAISMKRIADSIEAIEREGL